VGGDIGYLSSSHDQCVENSSVLEVFGITLGYKFLPRKLVTCGTDLGDSL